MPHSSTYIIPEGGSIVLAYTPSTTVRNTDYCWAYGNLTGNVKCEMDSINKRAIITGFDEYTT